MRLCIIALIVCLCTSVQTTKVTAQQDVPLGPVPPPQNGFLGPAEPEPAIATDELAPNPFRDFNSPESQIDQPGFAEASDQDLLRPNSPSNNAASNRPTTNRRPTPTPVSSSRNSSRSSNNSFSPRLARAAPIMGDSLSPSLQFIDPFHETIAQIPTGGSATRRKIGENTGAIPTDRVIFNYNHFHNALDSVTESTNIDRFTLGVEKTFLSNLFSIDVRLPLSANNDFVAPGGVFRRNGSELGNLSFALKCLLTSDDDSAFVAGLVVDTPTGSSTTATLPNGANLKFNNEAVHLAPFLGALYMQGSGFTHQAFLQVDLPTNANGFIYSDPFVVSTEFDEQSLLYFDYSMSKAVYQGGRGNTLERVSALAELHYTTTLEDSDVIELNTSNSLFDLSSQGNRIDVLNLTLGVDTLLSCRANVRFGTVVPLTDDDDRFFDIEFQAQVNFPL